MNKGKLNHNDIHLSFGLLFGNVNKLNVTLNVCTWFLVDCAGTACSQMTELCLRTGFIFSTGLYDHRITSWASKDCKVTDRQVLINEQKFIDAICNIGNLHCFTCNTNTNIQYIIFNFITRQINDDSYYIYVYLGLSSREQDNMSHLYNPCLRDKPHHSDKMSGPGILLDNAFLQKKFVGLQKSSHKHTSLNSPEEILSFHKFLNYQHNERTFYLRHRYCLQYMFLIFLSDYRVIQNCVVLTNHRSLVRVLEIFLLLSVILTDYHLKFLSPDRFL